MPRSRQESPPDGWLADQDAWRAKDYVPCRPFSIDAFHGETQDRNMNCHELAARIESLQPDAMPRDVARLCLLLANFTQDLQALSDEQRLSAAWRDIGIRLQAATDQHAAMTEELERLARTDPREFTAEQIWVLIRAIKVQSQVLQLYVGAAPSCT
jgi:hypothetical protein